MQDLSSVVIKQLILQYQIRPTGWVKGLKNNDHILQDYSMLYSIDTALRERLSYFHSGDNSISQKNSTYASMWFDQQNF